MGSEVTLLPLKAPLLPLNKIILEVEVPIGCLEAPTVRLPAPTARLPLLPKNDRRLTIIAKTTCLIADVFQAPTIRVVELIPPALQKETMISLTHSGEHPISNPWLLAHDKRIAKPFQSKRSQ